MLSYFEMFALNPPAPRRMGWGSGFSNFFVSIFSAVRDISRTFDILTRNTPGTWVKTNIIDFLDSS